MGRASTGVMETTAVMRLDISFLKSAGYLQKGCETQSYIRWSSGAEMAIRTAYTSQEQFVELLYLLRGEERREEIEITTVPSNLGAGEVPYFVCPIRRRRARILYRAYGSPIFKSREAYQHRIYYAGQRCSRYSRANTRYWEIEAKLEELDQQRHQVYYNGKETRRHRRRMRLLEQQQQADQARYQPENIPLSMRRWMADIFS